MKIIETKEEFDKVLNENKYVVADFYADWCGPCRLIAPKLEDLDAKFPNVMFVKVNVDENTETAEFHGINAMPTLLFFLDGKKADEVVGADISKITAATEKLVK